VIGALHDDVGKTIEGFDRLRRRKFATENETLYLPVNMPCQIFPYTTGDAEMELIDGPPQQIGIRHVLAAQRVAPWWARLDPHSRRQRQRRAARGNHRIEPHRLRRPGFQEYPDDASCRTATPFARRDSNRAAARHFGHVPAWACSGDQPRKPPHPCGDRIEGLNVHPRNKQRFGTGASDREHFDLYARTVEAFLQVEQDLAALHPAQMVAGALRTASDKPDGEDIDMPRSDLKHVAAVVEKLRVTAIEHDVARGPLLIGHRPDLQKERFTHSWATSFAYAA
jgi:hypothetical protein